jgi:hypothetical protein
MVSRVEGGDSQPGGTAEPMPGDTREWQVPRFAVRQQAACLPCDIPRAGEAEGGGMLHIRHGARRKFKGSDVA